MSFSNKGNRILLLASVAFIAFGFILMKAEAAKNGMGPLALTLAPILILNGYGLGIASIFHGNVSMNKWKNQLPFLAAGWSVFLVSLFVYVCSLVSTL